MPSKPSNHRRSNASPSLHVGVMPSTSEAAIWTRLIQPERNDLSEDAARSILRLSFSDTDRERVHELLVKNQDDALTPEEKAELENFRHVSYLLDLMHSKARRSLKKATT